MKTVKRYFIHNAKERKSTLWIVLLACVISSVPLLYGLVFNERITDSKFHDEIAAIDMQTPASDSNEFANSPYQNPENSYYRSNNNVRSSKKRGNYLAEKENLDAALFFFDPNTISKEQWIKLGLKPSAANRVKNYIGAGARFYKPGDIRKIWGVSQALQDRLVPYVTIAQNAELANTAKFKSPAKPFNKTREYGIVELNTADTAALIALPGIGEKLSQRIIDYRNKLGGFNSVEQVKEVWGIQDSVYQLILPYLKVNALTVTKLNINQATLEQLKDHPYIRYKFARIIVNYRHQHGNYKNAEDLKKIVILDDENLNKMLPYISF